MSSEAARTLGKLGGKASAASLTPEERQEKARKAARARWNAKKHHGNCQCQQCLYACRYCPGHGFMCDVCHEHDEPRGGCSVCPSWDGSAKAEKGEQG